ncbi:MAG: PIN domain-containing protein [Verrucomicrobiota bacterium]
MVLVDSCVWIKANQPKGDLLAKVALETLLEEDEAAFCGPVRLEVLGAMRRESRARFDTFFSLVPYLTMTDSSWEEAVKIGRVLVDEARVTLPWNDVMISAIALRHQARIYTLDAHFATLARHAGVKLYTPGPGGSYAPDRV